MLLEIRQRADGSLTDEGMVTAFLRTGNKFLHQV